MKFLFAFSLYLLVGQGSWAATITLSASSGTISEGGDMVVTCAYSTTAENREIIIDLDFDPLTTTAEDGYDADPISTYQCIIPANTLSSTVNIPTVVDRVIEATEVYAITGTASSALDTSTGTASFSVQDSGTGAPVTIRPLGVTFSAAEGTNLDITVEYIDDTNTVVPIEADYTLGFSFADDTAQGAAATAGTSDEDYDVNNPVSDNIIGSINGVAVLSAVVPIAIFDDTVAENLERFYVTLNDLAKDANIIVDSSQQISAWITDDDKPEIYVLNPYVVAPRRTRKVFRQLIFTDQPNDGIKYFYGPENIPDIRMLPLQNSPNGIDIRIRRPRRNPKARFGEFIFFTQEFVNGIPEYLLALSTVSATNRNFRASINVEHPALITAYPASADPGELNLGEPVTISVLGGNAKSRRYLRWSFFNVFAPGEKKLHDNIGMTSLQLTTVAEMGVYVIYPRQRGFQRGWVQYVRVILSQCPKGYFHETDFCNGGPIVCQHGGVVNPHFSAGLCTCPPGYAGRLCQYPINADQFGNNGQFSLVDMLGTSGRGITISQSLPFGTTCAPGFRGVGCQKKCSDGFFGPGCAFVCHCMDRHCSVTGVCTNGCDPRWQGLTCQDPVTDQS